MVFNIDNDQNQEFGKVFASILIFPSCIESY